MFNKIVEAKIQEAMRKGEFDNLPAKGQPINLEDWAKLPEDIRIGYMLLKNAGSVPEEMHLLKEIEALREQLSHSNREDERTIIRKKIREKEFKYNSIMERTNRKSI